MCALCPKENICSTKPCGRLTDMLLISLSGWARENLKRRLTNPVKRGGAESTINTCSVFFDRMHEDVYIKNILGSGGEVRTAFHETRLAITACGPE